MGLSVVGNRLDGSMQNSFGADCDSDRLQTGWPQRCKNSRQVIEYVSDVRPLSQGNLISYSSRRKSQSTLATCPLTNSSCEWIFGISTLTGDGVEVGSLDSPTAEPVQTIILSKDTRKRIVSLFLEKYPAKLQFREVEIYNGPLLGNDIHIKAILMIGVKSCTFTWAPFDAELFME